MLGFISGLLIAILIFVVEIYLDSKPLKSFKRIVKNKVKPGSIILPRTEREKSITELIKKNDSLGVDTPLEDIINFDYDKTNRK